MTNARTPISATGEDIEILARTIFGEARSEGVQGQAAVGYVIRHRAEIARAYVEQHKAPHPNFGNGSIANVCLDPYEFSCWNTQDPTRLRMLAADDNEASLQLARFVAFGVVTGQLEDVVPGATHYFNPNAVKAAPAWAKGVYASIGNHRFYSGVQ